MESIYFLIIFLSSFLVKIVISLTGNIGALEDDIDKRFVTNLATNKNTILASLATNTNTILASTVYVTITKLKTISITGCEPSTSLQSMMTIALTNMYGHDLSVSLESNRGAPSPIGNPRPSVLPNASPTEYIFPSGWAGRICVGPDLNPNGSKIEGSFTGLPDIDVSYVDGYTVPLVCDSEGIPVSGCNVELFDNSVCEDLIQGPLCLNSARFSNTSSSIPQFFRPCTGSAYTYPFDDKANRDSLSSNLVTCCIGTPCKPPSRQPGVNWRR